MEISVGVSVRHIHLRREDFVTLYGDIDMVEKSALNQPNNYASIHTATISTPKAKIENVRVLGPCREYTQVEISRTDAYSLGISPPVRESGDLTNAAMITISTDMGSVTLPSAIIAQRHIHISHEMRVSMGLPDVLSIVKSGIKGGVIADVHIKESNPAYYEAHIDTDEANAFNIKSGDVLMIKKD